MRQFDNLVHVIAAGGAPAIPVAPVLIGVSALVTGAGPNRLANYSAYILKPGDRIRVYCESRAAGTVTTTPPAGEGWTLIASARGVSHTFDVYEKTWGAGATDASRQTGTFVFSVGSALLSVYASVHRGVGSSVVTAVNANGSSATIATPVAASTPTATDVTWWAVAASGACAINTPTQGTLAAGDAAYNVSTGTAGGSMALAYSAPGFDSHATSCSFTESANSPRTSYGVTIVDSGAPPSTDGLTITQVAITAAGETRINGVGWTGGYYEDPIPHGGYYYSYIAFANRDQTLTVTSFREPVAGGARVQFSTWTSAVLTVVGISYWPGDSHFAITLGCSKTGRLHLFALAHGLESAMQYGHGSAPGDVTLTLGDWAGGVGDASYPQFENTADGTGLIFYRVGIAGGDAQQVMYEEKQDETGWTLITIAIMNFTDGGDDESPYMQQIVNDPTRDVCHFSWIWAEDNSADAYHSVMHVRATRTGVATWVWSAMDGSSITLPVNENTVPCQVANFTIATPANVHNGMTIDLTTGRPLISWMRAAGTVAGTGTNGYLSTWSGSAWVNNLVGLIHPTWNNIGVGVQRAVVRGPAPVIVGSKIYWTYSSDIELSSSGIPSLQARISTDGGATWGTAQRIVDLPIAGLVVRFDRGRMLRRGKLSCYFQLYVDDVGDGVGNVIFLYNVTGACAILDIVLAA